MSGGVLFEDHDVGYIVAVQRFGYVRIVGGHKSGSLLDDTRGVRPTNRLRNLRELGPTKPNGLLGMCSYARSKKYSRDRDNHGNYFWLHMSHAVNLLGGNDCPFISQCWLFVYPPMELTCYPAPEGSTGDSYLVIFT